MKKLIFFTLFIVFLFAFFGCSANSYGGIITVTNRTEIDAQNVKVGSYIIGFVGKGQVVNYYYGIEQTGAAISADGFIKAYPNLNGTIYLKYNFIVDLELTKQQNGSYYFNATARKVGGTGLADEIIQME